MIHYTVFFVDNVVSKWLASISLELLGNKEFIIIIVLSFLNRSFQENFTYTFIFPPVDLLCNVLKYSFAIGKLINLLYKLGPNQTRNSYKLLDLQALLFPSNS